MALVAIQTGNIDFIFMKKDGHKGHPYICFVVFSGNQYFII